MPRSWRGAARGASPPRRDLQAGLNAYSDSIDDALAGSDEGIRAVQLSLLGLGATALIQLGVVLFSGSLRHSPGIIAPVALAPERGLHTVCMPAIGRGDPQLGCQSQFLLRSV